MEMEALSIFGLWKLCEEVYQDPDNDAIDDRTIDSFKVWPNPSNGQLNISLSAGQLIQVRLMDVSGREVFNRVYTNYKNLYP